MIVYGERISNDMYIKLGGTSLLEEYIDSIKTARATAKKMAEEPYIAQTNKQAARIKQLEAELVEKERERIKSVEQLQSQIRSLMGGIYDLNVTISTQELELEALVTTNDALEAKLVEPSVEARLKSLETNVASHEEKIGRLEDGNRSGLVNRHYLDTSTYVRGYK